MQNCFRIRELREKAGLTQLELAVQIGIRSKSTIAMWEHGDRRPSSTILPRLAGVLGCKSIDELYIRDSSNTGT